ncbi:MAG TPA: RNA polymerase sigma factor [Ktedonobacteraceae bacterium]
MNEDEKGLLHLLALDQCQHFPCLVQNYQHLLYAFTWRLTGNAQDAEDLLQEAFLGIYTTLACYSPERIQMLKLRPWLYKITLNVFRNSKRGQHLNLLSLDQDESAQIPALSSDGPEWRYETLEQFQELEHLLWRLPEQYRVVVICYFFEQLTYQEIADLLDQPLGTVKSRLHRGLHLLRTRQGIQAEERNYANGAY